MEKRNISFSPPDISELEIAEVAEALRSGWITTGPRTKLLERRLAAYIDTGKTDVDCDTEAAKARYGERVVCLNSATAAEELNLRLLGIGPGDEVIVPAYSYTASASAAIHCGATVVFVDIRRDGDPRTHCPEMDYDALEAAITERTKAVVTVDLGGVVCDYDRVFEIVEKKQLRLPRQLVNIIRCRNPRCISSIEQELEQVFFLADEEKEIYRCRYCEEKYTSNRRKKS